MTGFFYENNLTDKGISKVIIGIDEAGRGPVAGPLVVGCVAYSEDLGLIPLKDSKRLSAFQREFAKNKLLLLSKAWSIGVCHAREIDRWGITTALRIAAKRAVNALWVEPDIVLMDGNLDPCLGLPTVLIVKGDNISGTIAAASIIAKTFRDDIMRALHKSYPQYGFSFHKGYLTKDHATMIERFGVSPEHRLSFAPLKHMLKPCDV